MPKIKTSRSKPAPAGFEAIKPQLEKFQAQLKDVEARKLKRLENKNVNLWQIIKIHNRQNRYIFDLRYRKKIISEELYKWLVKEKYADRLLISKWRKQGYEKLCCLKCIEVKCVCRVPGNEIECVSCGCWGCSSSAKRKKEVDTVEPVEESAVVEASSEKIAEQEDENEADASD